jgi:hypothetical protein
VGPPFTVTEFFNVFASYNEAVWPMQPVLIILAVAALALVHMRGGRASAGVAWILTFLWAWTAVAYHFAQFTSINRAAGLFGSLFVVQAALFAWWGTAGRRLNFGPPRTIDAVIGWVLVIYSLVVYPVLNRLTGHPYMASPTFGAPCPTTIFTFGLLHFARRPFPRFLLAVPIIWSVVGGSAAFSLNVPQDLGLVVAGLTGFALLFRMGPGRRGV